MTTRAHDMSAFPAADALSAFSPEKDSPMQWRAAYDKAEDRVRELSLPSNLLTLAIIVAVGIAAIMGASRLLGVPIRFGFMIYFPLSAALWDAWLLRKIVTATPVVPWPRWIREFAVLHDAMRPYRRALQRYNGVNP